MFFLFFLIISFIITKRKKMKMEFMANDAALLGEEKYIRANILKISLGAGAAFILTLIIIPPVEYCLNEFNFVRKSFFFKNFIFRFYCRLAICDQHCQSVGFLYKRNIYQEGGFVL